MSRSDYTVRGAKKRLCSGSAANKKLPAAKAAIVFVDPIAVLFGKQKRQIEFDRIVRPRIGGVVPGLQERIDRLFADLEDLAETEAEGYRGKLLRFEIVGPQVVGSPVYQPF